MITKIRLDNITHELLRETCPVLLACVYPGESWKDLIHTLDELSERYDRSLKVCVLHQNSIKAFCETYGIDGTPTFLIMKEGREQDRLLGEVDRSALESFVMSNIPALR